MANSISAEVWLDERRWDALEVVLEEQGSNIEQHLQEYLLDLYREMVPPGWSRPRSSASRIIPKAARSFVLPAGFRYSIFARILAFVIFFAAI